MESVSTSDLLIPESEKTSLAEQRFMFEIEDRICGVGCGSSDEKTKAQDATVRSAAAKKLMLASHWNYRI